jgi:hypothetical protein
MGEEEGLERMSRQAASIPARSPVTASELPPSVRSQGSGCCRLKPGNRPMMKWSGWPWSRICSGPDWSQIATALEIFQERRERTQRTVYSGPKIANLPGLERMWSGKARWMRKHRYSGDYSEWCLGKKYIHSKRIYCRLQTSHSTISLRQSWLAHGQ